MNRDLPPPITLFGVNALRLMFAITLVASAVFLSFPQLDLLVAHAVHDPETGFLLRDTPLHRFVDAYIRPGLKYVGLVALLVLAANLASRGRYPNFSQRKGLFVALSYILGPLLLVNAILKEFIGRARPKHLEVFGGDKTFSPAYWPADQCAGNCAFVSGDVAVAAATLAFALCSDGARRPLYVMLALIFTVLMGFYRIATGAHFLSDATLAGLFCILLTLVAHEIVLREGWRRFKRQR